MPKYRGFRQAAAPWTPAGHVPPLPPHPRHTAHTGRHVLQQNERSPLAHRGRQQLPLPKLQLSEFVRQGCIPSVHGVHVERYPANRRLCQAEGYPGDAGIRYSWTY